MAEPLDLAPIEERLAAAVEGRPGELLDPESRRRMLDALQLVAEVRRLRGEVERVSTAAADRPAGLVQAVHASMAQAWRESAWLVRETASVHARASGVPAGGPVVQVASLHALADRLDGHGAAAEAQAVAVPA